MRTTVTTTTDRGPDAADADVDRHFHPERRTVCTTECTSKLFLLLIAASLLTLLGVGPYWAASYFGVFKDDGSFMRGKGVTANSHQATGLYTIVFRANVSKCAYMVTLGGEDVFSPVLIAAFRGTDPHTVQDETLALSKTVLVDAPFTLLVTC